MTRTQINIHLSNHENRESVDQRIGKLRACIEAARSNPNTSAEQWATLRRQYQQLKDAIG